MIKKHAQVDLQEIRPDDQKINIRKLELQAGFPAGFVESIKSTIDEKSKLVSTTARTDPSGSKYLDVLTRDENGELKINSIYAGKVKGSSGSSSKRWATGTPNSYKEWDLAGKPGNYEDWIDRSTGDKPTEADKTKADTAEMGSKLQSVSGSDGYVSQKDYATAKKAWTTTAGYKAKDFDERFASFRNPDNDEYVIESW